MKQAGSSLQKTGSILSVGHPMPGAFFVSVLLGMPIITLIWLAANGTGESFLHVATTILPKAGANTAIVMVGVALLTASIGTISAWLVTHFEFPLRRVLQWGLMLPFAVPTYISAYTFVEFFSFTGPPQTLLRDLFGFTSSRDYWFPEIRSLWGTAFVLGLVLYPYVYLSVRALFLVRGSTMTDNARMLGAGPWRVFVHVTLPLVRPAIILGVVLALMETINDIGAVEYMGTNTLTLSVFTVWLNQNDLSGAAQIAIFLLLIVFLLIYLEQIFRGERNYDEGHRLKNRIVSRKPLSGKVAFVATTACLLPVLTGFGIPVSVLAGFALQDYQDLFSARILDELITTISLGAIAAVIAVIGGLILSFSLRVRPSTVNRLAVRTASIGYAVPGTLVALGVFIPLATFDNVLDGYMREYADFSTGLLLTGSGAALVFAYVVRFMAMAEGNLENGFVKISRNLDMAARNLGRTKGKLLSEVLLPMMKPAIYTAALLVFVEVVKELSATILLRPFGMNTLATHVYDYASQGRVEDGALACLLIVIVGIIPVALLIGKGN